MKFVTLTGFLIANLFTSLESQIRVRLKSASQEEYLKGKQILFSLFFDLVLDLDKWTELSEYF